MRKQFNFSQEGYNVFEVPPTKEVTRLPVAENSIATPEDSRIPIGLDDLDLLKYDTGIKNEQERALAIRQATEDFALLKAAANGFSNCLHGGGSATEYQLATLAYAQACRNLEHTPKNKIGMESYVLSSGKRLAMEAVMDSLRSVGAAILKAILTTIAWFKKVFKEYFNSERRLAEANVQMTTMFLKHRASNEKELLKKAETHALDEKRFVDLLKYKKTLTKKGEQTGIVYADAIRDIGILVSTHQLIRNEVSDAFIRDLKNAHTTISSGHALPSGDLVMIDPTKLFPGGAVAATHAAGLNQTAGMEMFVFEEPLGDSVLILEFNLASASNTYEEKLERLKEFKARVVVEEATLNNGWLRRLTTAEVKDAFKSMADLSHELIEFEKTEAILEHRLESLATLAKTLATQNATPNPNATTQQVLNEATLLAMAGAIGNLVTNISTTMTGIYSPAYALQLAWFQYLQATITKERAWLKS